MQQLPIPTPAPAPPAPQPSSVLLPAGPLPLEGVPQTAAEVRGLRERREVLRDQLERATNRRQEIVGELDRGGEGERALPAEARGGLQRRLDVIDERIIQLERDQAATERLLSNAPPAVLAATSEEPRQPGNMLSEDDAAGIAFGTFTAGVLLTIILGRMRRRWKARRGMTTNAKAAPALAADPRFAELAQAVGAIAEEVERIGEGQRFVTQLLSARAEERVLSGDPPRGR